MITLQIDHERFLDEPIIISMYAQNFLIGSHHKCDVKIITYRTDTYLEVKQDQSGVYIKSLSDHNFLHNGKKYQGQRKCVIGDVFQVDRSTIKIINLDLTKITTAINFTESKLKPEYETIFKAIQKELIYSDKEF